MKNTETIFDLALIIPCGNVLRNEIILAYLDNCLPMTKNQTVIPTACVVLAAGQGNRMESDLPKVLHPLAGRPMIGHVLASVESLAPERVCVVVGRGMEAVTEVVRPHASVLQPEPLGTGNAVRVALAALDGFTGDVLVLFGADPLVRPETLKRLLAARQAPSVPAVAVLGFRPEDPSLYGRLVVANDGALKAVVEAGDATPEQTTIGLCNGGVMAIDSKRIKDLIAAIGNDNTKNEFYLTDVVAIARDRGWACAYVEADADELIGVNSRADLARAEAAMQVRLRARAMASGAPLTDPNSVFLSFDTELGRDVTLGPNVVFGPGSRVGDNVEIKAFSHIEGATIGTGARVGPFARLRPGAEIGEGASIGNFVEIKNTSFGPSAKANHLAYVGDSTVGADANIGAGTITCNYDGYLKYRTEIGAGAFIGSNTALVAPVSVGAGALVGAGSIITKDVEANALAITRAPQKAVSGWAKNFNKRRTAEKTAAGNKGT